MLRLNKSDALEQKYANIVSECKHAIFKFDQAREDKILKANNLGAFYKFVNGKLNTHNGIAPLTDPHTGTFLHQTSTRPTHLAIFSNQCSP